MDSCSFSCSCYRGRRSFRSLEWQRVQLGVMPAAPNGNTTSTNMHISLSACLQLFSIRESYTFRNLQLSFHSSLHFYYIFIFVRSIFVSFILRCGARVSVWLWQKSFPAFEITTKIYVHKSEWSSFLTGSGTTCTWKSPSPFSSEDN